MNFGIFYLAKTVNSKQKQKININKNKKQNIKKRLRRIIICDELIDCE